MNDKARFDDPHLESLLPKIPFSRRGFIASSLASGFALAAGPVCAQTMIVTPTDGSTLVSGAGVTVGSARGGQIHGRHRPGARLALLYRGPASVG